MAKTTRDLDSLEVNKRALRRQAENSDNPATGAVTHKRRTLKAVGVIMPYDVSFQYMKENIEGKGVNTTLARMFAQQFANDTVELAFLGDESESDDGFISINDGWIKLLRMTRTYINLIRKTALIILIRFPGTFSRYAE